MAAVHDKKTDSDLKLISNDISYIREDVKEIKQTLHSTYVTKDQFEPVKKIVYGLVTLILVAVVGGLMGVILIK